MTGRIILVRHGRSASLPSGWMSRGDVERWRERYDQAGLAAGERAPDALRLTARTACVVSSDLRRAIESAALVAAGRPVITTPLLRESTIPIPALGAIRLPPMGWALAAGVAWSLHSRRATHPAVTAAAEQARAGAEWLHAVVSRHGDVVAITHAVAREGLVLALGDLGWFVTAQDGGRHANWSAWSLAPRAGVTHT